MKVYNSTRFYLLKKNENKEWDYFISSTPLTYTAISGILQLHQNEYNNILLELERRREGLTFKIDEEEYGLLKADEIEVQFKSKLGSQATNLQENNIITGFMKGE